MKSLTFLFLILLAPRVWADPRTMENRIYQPNYWNSVGSWTWSNSDNKVDYVDVKYEWKVSKGSETYVLYQFISSGKLCEFRGQHEWSNEVGNLSESPCGTWSEGQVTIYDPGQMCAICHRCRQKTKVTKDGEIWEK